MWTSCEQHFGALDINSTSYYAILAIKWVGQMCVCVCACIHSACVCMFINVCILCACVCSCNARDLIVSFRRNS